MSEALQKFADSARRYCAWCEGPAGDAATEMRTAFALVLALLNAIAAVEQGRGGGDSQGIPHEDFMKMHRRFASLPFQYYRSEFDPLDLEPEGDGMGDIADDLADIWRDLKPPLQLFDSADFAGAAFEWRYRFGIHWGRHAASALYPLHCWLVDNGEA